MRDRKRRYLAYLLRLWQVGSEGQGVWRASLEDPHSGECKGFGSVEALFEFLGQELRNQQSEVKPRERSQDCPQTEADSH